jgi:hypothetical protein
MTTMINVRSSCSTLTIALALAWGTGQHAFAQANPDDNRHVNVMEWPYLAAGDGIGDDTAAINSAINAARSPQRLVYLPAGTYKITSTLCFNRTAKGYALGLVGEGRDSVIISADPIRMITVDTGTAPSACGGPAAAGGRMDNLRFENFTLVNSNAGVADTGIALMDPATAPPENCTDPNWVTCHWLANNTFKDISFFGTSYGIRNERASSHPLGFFDWNLFTGLKFANYGNNLINYAIKFDRGSGGTGNVFSNMTMITCNTACIAMGDRSGGPRTEWLGDILFSSLHMSGNMPTTPTVGIQLTGGLGTGGGAYGHRISVVNSQMDAGIDRGLDFFDIHAFSVVGTLFGGETTNSFEACSDYILEGTGTPDVVPPDPNPANPTIQLPARLKLQSEHPWLQPNLVLAGGVEAADRTPRIRFTGPWSVSNPREAYAQIMARNDNGGGGPGFNGEASLRFFTSFGEPALLSEKLIVTGPGNVGIGTSAPAYKLHVNGSAAATSWTTLSSRDYKREIASVDPREHASMLDTLMKLDLRTYRYKPEFEDGNQLHIGLIAEDLPAAVLSQDGKAVDLYGLLTYTIGAMKAQETEIQSLKARLNDLTALESARERPVP